MKANEVKLTEFLSKTDTQFVIPIYQRNYDWKIVHCEQLMNDILYAGENRNMHFIGSIVYIHDGVYSSDIKELVVIDGQQRITTITLLCIALYHYLKENDAEWQANKIYKQFIINEFARDNQRLKLKASENNAEDLKTIINGTHTSETSLSSIIINYNYFKSCISSDNVNTILDGIGMLMFVEISLDRTQDNAQRIFESLNSTGLDLSQADLIRNYILMNLTASQQTNIYEKYWSVIESATRVELENMLPSFIRDYLTYKTKSITKESEVYKAFKENFPYQGIEQLETVLGDISKLSIPYSRLLQPIKEKDDTIRLELQNIVMLKLTTSYPFLMKVYDDYLHNVIDKDAFIRILQFIQTFAVRRFILDLPTNSFNKIFMVLYDKIDFDKYEESIYQHILSLGGKARMPKDAEIVTTLPDKDIYNTKGKYKEYLFERLENWQNRELVTIVGNEHITIEHIFPQTPNDEWKLKLPKAEYEDFLNVRLHTIGNLTLSGNNGSLGNKSFEQKRDMNNNGGEQGYSYSRLWLNSYLKTLDKWDIDTYSKRTNLLIDRFLQIWKLPDVELESTHYQGEYNIFEIDDPTNKQMEYALFFGRKIRTNESKLTHQGLLISVVKLIFEMTPTDFMEKVGFSIGITRDISELRKPIKIHEDFYIETNLSAKAIFTKVKSILSTYNLTDELFICFKEDEE